MEIGLVTDTHFGSHKNSEVFLKSSMDFFKNQFLPDLRKRGIDTIIHMGDVFDVRTSMNIHILNEVYKLFTVDGKDFKWYLITGNHDSYYKSTIETNSLKHLQDIPNITVIQDIEKINFDGRDILMIPWQVDHKQFIKRVNDKQLDCEVAIGHLEITGFYLNKGRICDDGVTSDIFFNNFKIVFSGHFHKRNEKKVGDNVICYTGNAYHITRNDIGEDRGYTIFNTDTLKYEYVNNTVSLQFKKIRFPEKFSKEDIKGNIIDIYVQLDDNYNETKFQIYLNKLEKCEPALPANVKIINDFESNQTIEYKVQSVTDLINEYVCNLNISYKDEIIKKILTLYNDNKNTI